MFFFTRALAVALTAGTLNVPAASAARVSAATQPQTRTAPTAVEASFSGCRRERGYATFRALARGLYRGSGSVRVGTRRRLLTERRCSLPAARSRETGAWVRFAHSHRARVRQKAAARAVEPYFGCTSQDGCQRWAVPACIVDHESAGVNNSEHPVASSGFYQVAEMTWHHAFGVSYAYQASKLQQSIVAHRVWDGGAGASAWTTAAGCGF